MSQILHISETISLGQIDQLYLLVLLRTQSAISDLEFQILEANVTVHPGGHPELRCFRPRAQAAASGSAGPRDQGAIHGMLEIDGAADEFHACA